MIVDHGSFQYKFDKNSGQLDSLRQSVIHCHEMVTNSRDRLLCNTMGEHFNALAYSKDGKLQDSRQLNMTDPRSIAYDSSNFMPPPTTSTPMKTKTCTYRSGIVARLILFA